MAAARAARRAALKTYRKFSHGGKAGQWADSRARHDGPILAGGSGRGLAGHLGRSPRQGGRQT